MKDNKYDKKSIMRIAEECGLSVSSVQKILSNPFEFSHESAERVHAIAYELGLTQGDLTDGQLKLGVVIPCRPSYFWREAAQGMKRAQLDWEKERSKRISLVFTYYESPITPDGARTLFDSLRSSDMDGYIVYPVCEPACVDFIRHKGADVPVVVFNESRASFSEAVSESGISANFAEGSFLGAATAFVGADNAGEGRAAAMIIDSEIPHIRRVVTIITTDSSFSGAAKTRVGAFRSAVLQKNPDVSFENIGLEVRSKITSAFLTRRLYELHSEYPIDCVYTSSGVTNIACAAIEKLKRRFGCDSIKTFCIGHEFSPSDKRYLLDGTQRGYVCQDIYAQGRSAVDIIMNCLTFSAPVGDLYCKSHVFIRTCL